MTKRRYTAEEIYEMKTQIFEDNQAERLRFEKIAEWATKKAQYRCNVEFSEYASSPDNPHIPYYYIGIPMSQYGNPTPWIMDGVLGPDACKPPVAGINIRSKGWMITENIPGAGNVTFYICVENYDSHSFGW